MDAATFSVAATALRRYLIPEHGVCSVRAGIEMVVRDGLIVDGLIVLDGLLTVGEL